MTLEDPTKGHKGPEAAYGSFEDFAAVLQGHDNINVADIEGGYPARENFMRALVRRAGIETEVRLSAPDRVQPFCNVTKDGSIYIEVLGEVTEDKDTQIATGTYKTWTIAPDFSVTRGEKPYSVDHKH